MSEIAVEGLRQAFLDPGSRIRLDSDSTPDKHAELVSLTWEGGFLDGAAIRFNPNMNVLVGGRGTGQIDRHREPALRARIGAHRRGGRQDP